jgi:hypothetical protein
MVQHEGIKVRMRRTQQQIDELLSQYEEGGYNVKEFCQMNGLNRGNFHKWLSRRKVAGLNDHASSGFSKVVLQSSPADHLFAEVSGIRLYQAVSAAYLKELAR